MEAGSKALTQTSCCVGHEALKHGNYKFSEIKC